MSVASTMARSARLHLTGEAGFTFVELLAVMLILGLLAAIAIPAFFGQANKARDAAAKSAVRTAETAIEAYYVGNDGSYGGSGAAALDAIEPTLAGADLDVTGPAGSGPAQAKAYRVRVTSATGNHFWVERDTDGRTTMGCDASGRSGCPSTGRWG
jgi:type IV pilus assembly protein PilA